MSTTVTVSELEALFRQRGYREFASSSVEHARRLWEKKFSGMVLHLKEYDVRPEHMGPGEPGPALAYEAHLYLQEEADDGLSFRALAYSIPAHRIPHILDSIERRLFASGSAFLSDGEHESLESA